MAERPRRRRVTFTLLTAALGLAGLLVLEALMIVLEPWASRGFYQYDADLGFRVRPGTEYSNRSGFNDRDYPLAPEAGVLRILVVGDSFGWAGGMERNYTAILERRFEEHYGSHRVDVVNASFPMTHTGEQLVLLEKFGLPYQPRLVVLGFFLGNDFFDYNPVRKRIVVNDTYFDIDRRQERTVLGYPMVGKSRLVHFLGQRLKVVAELLAPGSARGTAPGFEGELTTFSEPRFLEIESARMSAFHRSFVRDPRARDVPALVSLMRDRVVAAGSEFCVAMYPDEFQVNPALQAKIFQTAGYRPEDFDLDLLQKVLAARLDREGTPYIDLTPGFRAAAEGKELYLPRNTHWNDAGNELAAALLFDYLLPRVDRRLATL